MKGKDQFAEQNSQIGDSSSTALSADGHVFAQEQLEMVPKGELEGGFELPVLGAEELGELGVEGVVVGLLSAALQQHAH